MLPEPQWEHKKDKKAKTTTKAVEEIKEAEPNEPTLENVTKDKLGEPPEFDFDRI